MENNTGAYRHEPSNAERVNNDAFIRSRIRRKRTERFRKIVSYGLAAAISLGFLILCAITFFKVNTITVSGNVMYSSEEIVAASGIKYGQNLYELDRAKIEEKIIMNHPFVRSVRVKREVPSTVELIVEEEQAVYLTDVAGEYFLLSKDYKVMARFPDPEDAYAAAPRAIRLYTPRLGYAVVGAQIRFAKESNMTLINQIISDIEHSKINGTVNSVNFSDRFNIEIVFSDHDYKLLMGSYDADFLKKINFGYEISRDESLNGLYAKINLQYGDPATVTVEKYKFTD